MEIKKKVEEKTEFTKEELKNINRFLTQENSALKQNIEKMNMNNVLQRLHFLFKVIENPELYSSDFVTYVVKEIEYTLYIPEEEEKEIDK